MTINGTDLKDEMPDFIKNMQANPSDHEEDVAKNIERALRESNIFAEIPARFKDALLSDYQTDFEDELMSYAIKPEDKIFFLCGSSGVGKTTLQCAAIHERAIHGLDAGRYFSIRFLLPKLRTSRSFSASVNEEMLIKDFCTASFLCLDEVGTCENQAEERYFIRTVLAGRYDNMLPTFISTNLNVTAFKQFIVGSDNEEAINKDPIIDRIRATLIYKKLVGDSNRGVK